MTLNRQDLASEENTARILPLLTLRGLIITPFTKLSLTLGRDESLAAVRRAVSLDPSEVAVCVQNDEKEERPALSGLFPVGVASRISNFEDLGEGKAQCLLTGYERFKLLEVLENDEQAYREARFIPLGETPVDKDRERETLAVLRANLEYALEHSKETVRPLMEPGVPPGLIKHILNENSLALLTDELTQTLQLENSLRLILLSEVDPLKRASVLLGALNGYSYAKEIERKVMEQTRLAMERSQREYFLNEQMRVIKKELKLDYDDSTDADTFREQAEKLDAPEEVRERLRHEIVKFHAMNPNNSEYTMVRNYIETLLDIPWRKSTKVRHDLKKAQAILEQEHYGLKKVKERILEFLAVQAKADSLHGPILCLMGPPGIGKTSLGQSMAKATGREYVRVALGGLHDEAEIRGHRRTYIGALPGRIIQNMIKAGVNNPLFLLDEIDKVSDSIRGDPADALLEVLDPEQNSTFEDNYVELPYDLSNVMFVTTANSYNISAPLLDRMEVIDLASYTEDEKFNIAKKHLLPKQLRANALTAAEFDIEDEAIYELIRYYTHEAGVRGLERLINELARKTVKEQLLAGKVRKRSRRIEKVVVGVGRVHEQLGPRRYDFTSKLKDNKVGLVNGLAWTSLGGDILQLEAVANEGKGKHQLTGKLGEVMKESIGASITLVRTLAKSLRLDPAFYETCDLHIHVPEGATPKEGPSAGVGMVTAIVSALTGNPVRADVAMTGEITLRGDVLPIGGLKEKLLAALRGGIKTVFIPFENEKDLYDIPENVKNGLEIIPVRRVEQILPVALVNDPFSFSPVTSWAAGRARGSGRRRKAVREGE